MILFFKISSTVINLFPFRLVQLVKHRSVNSKEIHYGLIDHDSNEMEIKDFSKGEEGMDDDVLEVDKG